METKTNRYTFFLSFFLYSCMACMGTLSGQTFSLHGFVRNEQNTENITYINLVLSSPDSLFIQGTSTDSTGCYAFPDLTIGNFLLTVSGIGFETKQIFLQNLSEETIFDVLLESKGTVLDEIVVSASSRKMHVDHRVVFPTSLQRSHASSGFSLLSAITFPGIRVNPMLQTVSSSDGRDVVLQINGRMVSVDELITLRPQQVRRIEFYDYAGIRYKESAAVINYILHESEKGGIVGVNLMNSVDIPAGGDYFFVKFNQGKAEFGLNYTTAFQDFNSNYREEFRTFYFDDKEPLFRNEINDRGEYLYYMHDVRGEINYRLNDSCFFNGNLKYNLSRQPHRTHDNWMQTNYGTADRVYEGLKQHIESPSLDLYYQHSFPRKQKIFATLVLSYLDSRLQRDYYEYNAKDTLVSEYFLINTYRYALLGEAVYEKTFTTGVLKAGLQHTQAFNKLHYRFPEHSVSDLRQTESFLFAEWSGSRNKWTYSGSIGLNRVNLTAESINNTYYHFLPKLMTGFRFNDRTVLRYELEMNQTSPTLMQLTETEIRKDSLLTEKGNATLQPFCNIKNNFFVEIGKELFTGSLFLRHHYRDKPIMDAVYRQNNRFVLQPKNMHNWQKWNAELTTKIGMIANIFQLSLTGGYNSFRSRGTAYLHHYSNFYYRADLLALYRQWMLIAQIQTADKHLEGETVISETGYTYLGLQYTHAKFSLGVGAFNPFYNLSKSEWDNRNKLTPFKRTVYSNASQTVVLTFTWNLNFGKSFKGTEQRRLQRQDPELELLGL